jgi:hypothetical protein
MNARDQERLRRTRCICEWPGDAGEYDAALARCRSEQRAAAEQLAGGACDRRGLTQCLEDWCMEEALLLLARQSRGPRARHRVNRRRMSLAVELPATGDWGIPWAAQ